MSERGELLAACKSFLYVHGARQGNSGAIIDACVLVQSFVTFLGVLAGGAVSQDDQVEKLKNLVRNHMQEEMKFANLITNVSHKLEQIIKAETVVYDENEKSDVIVSMDETEMISLAESAMNDISAALRQPSPPQEGAVSQDVCSVCGGIGCGRGGHVAPSGAPGAEPPVADRKNYWRRDRVLKLCEIAIQASFVLDNADADAIRKITTDVDALEAALDSFCSDIDFGDAVDLIRNDANNWGDSALRQPQPDTRERDLALIEFSLNPLAYSVSLDENGRIDTKSREEILAAFDQSRSGGK